MKIYFGRGAGVYALADYTSHAGFTWQEFYGVMIGDYFIGITRWRKDR